MFTVSFIYFSKKPVAIDTKTYRIVPICIPVDSTRFQNRNGFVTGYGTYLLAEFKI